MISYASYSDTGGRPCNEDSVRIINVGTGLCAVLADGLGGHGGGDAASEVTVETVSGGFNGTSSPSVLTDLITDAHRRIITMQTPSCEMKSTVVVLTVDGNKINRAHVGDSRLYHFENGILIDQTRDHSASQIAVMLGQITPEQIRFHEDRSRLFRALGQPDDLSIDTAEETLKPGKHAFLLCSDGFWEYVYESEMTKALAESSSPEQWIEKMREVHKTRIPPDNDNNTAAAVWVEIKETKKGN